MPTRFSPTIIPHPDHILSAIINPMAYFDSLRVERSTSPVRPLRASGGSVQRIGQQDWYRLSILRGLPPVFSTTTSGSPGPRTLRSLPDFRAANSTAKGAPCTTRKIGDRRCGYPLLIADRRREPRMTLQWVLRRELQPHANFNRGNLLYIA